MRIPSDFISCVQGIIELVLLLGFREPLAELHGYELPRANARDGRRTCGLGLPEGSVRFVCRR